MLAVLIIHISYELNRDTTFRVNTRAFLGHLSCVILICPMVNHIPNFSTCKVTGERPLSTFKPPAELNPSAFLTVLVKEDGPQTTMAVLVHIVSIKPRY
jgi:hypothetical protein